jgi:hypothetical protein
MQAPSAAAKSELSVLVLFDSIEITLYVKLQPDCRYLLNNYQNEWPNYFKFRKTEWRRPRLFNDNDLLQFGKNFSELGVQISLPDLTYEGDWISN